MYFGPECTTLINRANIAVSEINKMQNVSEVFKKNALGECYFLKAWAYFYLVRAYGAIPIYSVSVNESGQYTNNPRIPIAQVYTETIIPLLKDAKDMIYKNSDNGFKPRKSLCCNCGRFVSQSICDYRLCVHGYRRTNNSKNRRTVCHAECKRHYDQSIYRTCSDNILQGSSCRLRKLFLSRIL